MISAEQVYAIVQRSGPLIANKIKQLLGAGDVTLVNVYLSQLKDEGKIKFTHVQLGSSSFVYTPEQTAKLAQLAEHLNEKDKRVAKKLEQEKILQFSTQDPLTRVSLQNIKDFAKPLQVRLDNGEEVFYRWYAYPLEDAKKTISSLLEPQPQQEKTPETPTKQPIEETPQREEIKPNPPVSSELTTKEPSTQVTLTHEKSTTDIIEDAASEFANLVLEYFEKNRIEVRHFKEQRKNSEIEAIITVPTAVGKVTFYCKARNKKSSNDGDLASAILSAKARMLPALYLTTGDVTTKAKENPELQEITVIEYGNSN